MGKTIQSEFLDTLQQEKRPVTIITVNGFQIKGLVTGHDQFTIQMEDDGRQLLIYKHAVSTIVRREN